MAEWRRSGLQSREPGFESPSGLQDQFGKIQNGCGGGHISDVTQVNAQASATPPTMTSIRRFCLSVNRLETAAAAALDQRKRSHEKRRIAHET